MMRFNLDTLSQPLMLDLISAVSSPSDAVESDEGAFDEHLERAWRATEPPRDDPPADREPASSANDRRRPQSSEKSRKADPPRKSARREVDRSEEETDPPCQAERPSDEKAEDEETLDAAAAEVAGSVAACDGAQAQEENSGQDGAEEGNAESADKTLAVDCGKPKPAPGPNAAESQAAAETPPDAEGQATGEGTPEEAEAASEKGLPPGLPPEKIAETSEGKGTRPDADRTDAETTEDATEGAGPAIPAQAAESSAAGSPDEAVTSDAAAAEVAAVAETQTEPGRAAGRSRHAGDERSGESPFQKPEANTEDASPQTNQAVEPQTQPPPQPADLAVPVAKGAADAAEPAASGQGSGEGEVASVGRTTASNGGRTASTADASKPAGAEQAERARFVQRVTRAFEAMGDRSGTIRLRLHPAELGELKLQLTVRNGTMDARLEVETAGARSALLENLPALRERLAEHNIKVERFDIDYMDHASDGSSREPGQQSQSREQSRSGTGYQQVSRGGASTETVTATSAGRRSEPGRLDVVI